MDLSLVRKHLRAEGIFSELLKEDGSIFCVTLEHAYLMDQKWSPKLPNGTYECVKGSHMLHSSMNSFLTFEITLVPNHIGILFHPGNLDQDSAGCVLLGQILCTNPWSVLESRVAFNAFMALQSEVDSFTLTVL